MITEENSTTRIIPISTDIQDLKTQPRTVGFWNVDAVNLNIMLVETTES